jgi:hypothetical protein
VKSESGDDTGGIGVANAGSACEVSELSVSLCALPLALEDA